jgi:hypothetical protein
VVEDHLGDQAIASRVGMAIHLEEQPLALARYGLEIRREVEVGQPGLTEMGRKRCRPRGRLLVEQRQIDLFLGRHQQHEELAAAALRKGSRPFHRVDNQAEVRVIRLRPTLVAGIKGGCELKLTAIGKIDGPATELRSHASSRVLQ